MTVLSKLLDAREHIWTLLSYMLQRLRSVGGVSSQVKLYSAIGAFTIAVFYIKRYHWQIGADVAGTKKGPKGSKDGKSAVDGEFFRRLRSLLGTVIPGFVSTEGFYLLLVAVVLFARTYCDLWVMWTSTTIESSVVARDATLFRRHLLRFIFAMPALSLVNNLLKFGLSELKLRFRNTLTRHLYTKYLRGFTYYKMSNLDNRISNPDQLLTQDVDKFCDTVVELYSNLSKPLLDIILYSVKLTTSVGAQAPGMMLAYLVASGVALTWLRRPTGRMTVAEQHLEGDFRHVTSRLITNSEEVAFYKGNEREKTTIFGSLSNLIEHLREFIQFRFAMGYVDTIVAKYVASSVGYWIVSRPFLNMMHPRFRDLPHTELLQVYYNSGSMLVRLSEALGRVALAGREMTRLSGYTSRLTEIENVLDDLERGHYERTMIGDTEKTPEVAQIEEEGSEDGSDTVVNPPPPRRHTTLVPGSGNVQIRDNIIRFEEVPLVTPNGDVLIETMNFEVPSGRNVLVCGPNGCGKSSLFRVLGELWPLFGGTLIKPEAGKLFYVPQRPYMTIGTLRDQIIYPDSHADQKRRGVTDEDLNHYLELIQLSYLLDREGGWDSVRDWMDVLSGGEKQRVAMARIFYHRPQFAILDECTSAVSVDVEGYIYSHCRKAGITLFTVSHRKSLWKHHEYYLHMDGRGAFEYEPITEKTLAFGT